jgi:superoxide dismutase, Cu-Zn family
MRPTKTSIAAVGVVATLAVPMLSACGSSGSSSLASTQAPAAKGLTDAVPAPPPPVIVIARFQRYGPNVEAVTYDPELVPVGSDVVVVSASGTSRTSTVLVVHGLVPNRTYGAHVHVNACGADPEASGPHYQHEVDPNQPSVDPAYANPQNEIWLDFTTDASGDGRGESNVDWTFTDRRPRSVVIHAHRTDMTPGHAGEAGARIACVNVPF